MSARRDALFLVLAAFTWLVVCATVAGCERNEQASYPSPVSSSVAATLVALAPVVGRTSFGPGVHVSIFNPSWLFSGARVVDETLYAMYYTKQSDDQRIAVVSRGVLHRVSFSRKYYALTFENDNRVIAAGMANEVKDWYLLQGDRAIAIPRPDSPVYGIPHHVLADGDSCSDGMAGSGSALDDLREHHRVSILTDAAMSRATNGALSKAVGVYCDHFHGKNYVTMDAPGVIFRLDGQEASLVSAGWVEAASDRHLLIETDDTFIEAEVP